ncbi:hypothetical protein QWY82_17615 [Simiduia curdlanivorans]|uniref:Uncharacterized protein n=1 Tax=Simiduia curdlanivorans TaxID=1492769 RepID=A0ABV8V7I0_9GAMM|nr:hypothetical protein [Simiduia curdlanivorans]MDN3640619.1 hypothetical protein [Simiduia curdlanivorans]
MIVHSRLINAGVFCLACLVIGQAQAAEVTLDAEGKPCEEMVDLSETGQFHRLHFECAEDKPAPHSSDPAPVQVPAPVLEQAPLVAQTPARAAEILTVRASLELANADSLQRAQHQLFQKMVQVCTHGWRKVSESVVPEGQHQYQLTVQYRCLGR